MHPVGVPPIQIITSLFSGEWLSGNKMNDVYIPLLSALAGALIGSFSSIATVWIQAKLQNKRELTKIATEAAIEDYRIAYDFKKVRGNVELRPLSAWSYFHIRTLVY